MYMDKLVVYILFTFHTMAIRMTEDLVQKPGVGFEPSSKTCVVNIMQHSQIPFYLHEGVFCSQHKVDKFIIFSFS